MFTFLSARPCFSVRHTRNESTASGGKGSGRDTEGAQRSPSNSGPEREQLQNHAGEKNRPCDVVGEEREREREPPVRCVCRRVVRRRSHPPFDPATLVKPPEFLRLGRLLSLGDWERVADKWQSNAASRNRARCEFRGSEGVCKRRRGLRPRHRAGPPRTCLAVYP